MSDSKPYIGGQAVIEGVMMRGPACLSVAVRRPDGALALQEGPFESRFGAKVFRLPGLRGIATLVDSFGIGARALGFSADQQLDPSEREANEGATKGSFILAIVLAVGLFIALPQLLASGAGKLFGFDLGLDDTAFHAIIGAFKLAIFFAYVVVIGRIPEVRRVFQYHGAEHKTIHAYEQGLPLTVENVRKQTTMHPRCGTTFIVVVIIVSVVVGSLVAPLVLPDAEGLVAALMLLALRIALLPPIAAVSFELQRLGARYCTTGPLRVLLYPGFLFQKLTTREPEDAQIEVAICALQAAEWRGRVGASAEVTEEPLVFPTFAGFRDALPALRPARS